MAITVFFFSVSDQKTEKYLESFTFSCWTWWVPSAGTRCYLNQERGTRNGCIAVIQVIHIRIQVKNPFHKVLSRTSESKERVLKTGAQALFFVSSSAILNSYGDYRWKPDSRPTFPAPRSPLPAPRSPLPVLRSPILILVQNLPCLKCVFSSVLNSRSSLHNLCFYLRSVLRVLHEYKIQINAQCKAFKAPLNIFTSA